MNRITAYTLFSVAMLIAITGCTPYDPVAGRLRLEARQYPRGRDVVPKIEKGRTTQEQICEWYGYPTFNPWPGRRNEMWDYRRNKKISLNVHFRDGVVSEYHYRIGASRDPLDILGPEPATGCVQFAIRLRKPISPKVIQAKPAPPTQLDTNTEACVNHPDVGLARRQARGLDKLAGRYSDAVRLKPNQIGTVLLQKELEMELDRVPSCVLSLTGRSTQNFDRNRQTMKRLKAGLALIVDRASE